MRSHRLSFGSLVAACAFTSLALAGCGRPESDTNTPNSTTPSKTADATIPPTPAGDFKIALVMSGSTSDGGWNAGALKAFQAVKSNLSLSDDNASYIEKQTAAGDQEKSLREFATKKYNMVFGHGSEYEAPALKMETDFPGTLFVISSGRQVGKNTMPIVFQLEDGAYLEGMVAAAMSKSGTIASVGAEESVPLKSIFKAFEAGAKSVKSDIKVLPPVYTGSWDDVGKAKQTTLALIDQGADVIMQDVDSAAQGVFNAVQERAKTGKTVYALGTNSDQNASAPDVILASAPIYSDKAFVAIAKDAKAGTLKPSDKPYGMKEGVVDFVLNPAMKARIPKDLQTKLADMQKKITDGSFSVPKEKS
ncbi:MAG: nucleoside-binding protein [Chthonomonadaceae bacterium]|nr:nucleoside-binding protein [Chthonomonadaceae bacterium]